MAETKTINLNVETNIDELSVKINDINQKLYKLYAAEKDDANATLKLIAEKKKLQSQLNDLNKVVQNNTNTIKNNKLGYDSFGNSVNQITRELPAFTNSLNTGFMAISNNLPILFDEINKVKQANVELAASGKPTVSVFKTLTSAIFSWGTALSLGVTLLTVYGGKIIEYFTKDNEQRKKNNELISESSKYVAKESTEYIGLITSLKNTNQGSKERKDLIEKINSQYSTTLKNIDDERLFQDQLNNSIKDYLIYQRAKFELKKNEEKITSILQRQSEVQNKLAGAEINLQRIQSEGAGSGRFAGGYENYNETLKEAEKQVQRYTYSNNQLNKQLEALGYTQLQLIGQTEGLYIPVKEEEKKKIEEIRDLQNEIRQEEIKRLNDKHLEEYAQLQFDAEKRIKEIEDSTATEEQKAQLILLIKRNLLNDQLELDKAYNDAVVKEEADKNEKLKEERRKEQEEISKIQKKFLDDFIKNKKQEIEDEKNKRQAMFDIAKLYTNSIISLNEFAVETGIVSAKKGFQVSKALAITQATISTIEGVVNALTAKSVVPEPFGQALKVANAVAIGAAGAANIAKISHMQFNPDGNNTPNTNSNIPTASLQSMTPQFNVVGGNQTSQLLQGLSMQPLKAYVVASDITTAQMLEQKAIKTSVL
jgi:hypothetical protein